MLWNPSALNDYPTAHASRWRPGEQGLGAPLSIDWIDWTPCVAAEAVDEAFDESFHTCLGTSWASR